MDNVYFQASGAILSKVTFKRKSFLQKATWEHVPVLHGYSLENTKPVMWQLMNILRIPIVNQDFLLPNYFNIANRNNKSGNHDRFYFHGLQKSLQMVTAAIKLEDTCSLEEKL